MSPFIRVAELKDFAHKNYKCFTYLTKPLVVIKKPDGSFYAMEAACKHQNANLFTSGFTAPIITCPRHGWQYNVETGACLTEDWAYLRFFPLEVRGSEIFVSMSPVDPPEEDDFDSF